MISMQIKTFKGGYDDNFSYVIYSGKKCCIIDPAVPAQEILDWIKHEGLELQFVVVMHSHHDHIVDLDAYKDLDIEVYGHESTKDVSITKKVDEGDLIGFGETKFKVLHTPGHIYDCICLLGDGKLFTSDTLFVQGCGRVDFAGSEPEKMFDTLQRLKNLPEDIIVYPGHDYGSTPTSTIGREKKNNQFFEMSKEEFLKQRLGL
jgi:hydroxyacylglutathione hydrolase